MKKRRSAVGIYFGRLLTRLGIGMRAKLIIIFLLMQALPLVLLTIIAWQQVYALGDLLREIAVEDSVAALNNSAVDNIERMSTDTAAAVANFLYERDDDIRYLAALAPSADSYRLFGEARQGFIAERGQWQLSEDGSAWVQVDPPVSHAAGGASTNSENNDMDGFSYRAPKAYTSFKAPLYDEITFIGLDGMEQIKYVSPRSTKTRYPLSGELRDVSRRANTYVRAETYFEHLKALAPGEIYVSDVIGAYVGSNYIGLYTPDNVAAAARSRGYEIEYDPEGQAWAGEENPNGRRFEGIVRWATPVVDESGAKTGYVTFALNHDHIMEFVDHITPMQERYTQLPSAYEGNYAFIWDYRCRSISRPRHHSIVGYDPETGEPQTPWLETSVYEAWQASGIPLWHDYVESVGYPPFFQQSRAKKPADALTRAGLVGLDGRYLNNAPQCTGWMDLTAQGGSGSFYILWSGIYKLNTAAAIPYYTGQYAPSEANGYSLRGFGFVAIGARLEDFTRPASAMETRLIHAATRTESDITARLIITAGGLLAVAVAMAVLVAGWTTGRIRRLIGGIGRFQAGARHFRYNEPVKDEFGALADAFDEMADSLEDSAKNPLCITDMDGRVIYMNALCLGLRGETLEQLAGAPYADISIYPSGTPYDPILALREGRETEIYCVEQTGRYVRGTANYLLDKNGRRVGYIIETVDMTDLVLEQKRIEEQKSLLDRIFSTSPELVWYMDAQGAYSTVNPRFAAIVGRPEADFTGKRAEDILPPALARGFAVNDREAIRAGAPFCSEERVTFADGHSEVLDTVRTPIYDTAGRLTGLLGFARNVTVRVEMEQRLRDTQQALERTVREANRANAHKGEFLARMSHEIRTPMNAIIGLTGIVQKRLRDLAAPPAGLDAILGHVGQIETSSQHLLGLLNDILDLSKIEAGRIELVREAVELTALADTVAGIIRPRCEEKRIAFQIRCAPFQTAFLTDSLRLRQVLINLLGNAVKFTPQGGTVAFTVAERARREGESQVIFTVRDTGMGIPPQAVGKIFDSFEQGSADVARTHGGTGLGLAISQRIVHMMGGRIEVESVLHGGSTFSFSIWLPQTQRGQEANRPMAARAGSFAGRRMLLVDDVDINRMIVAAMLEDTGIDIEEAGDGRAAVRAVERAPAGYYDLVLMDVQMPVMNGYQATQAIRALPRADVKTLPIVALTANAFKEDIDRAAGYGMNGHIAKPVEVGTLMALLARFLMGKQAETNRPGC